jgi:hypothetical protein
MKTRHLAMAAAAVALAVTTPSAVVHAQDTAAKPLLSPRDTARGTVGAAHVLVDYSRPSKRGRQIFGDSALVSYGKVWRTGANAATTFVIDKDLTVGGTAVPAGTYTLFTIPTATGWTLIVNKQTGQRGTDYSQAQDLARIPMTVTTLSSPVEKFEISVGDDSMLHLRWDTVDAAVALATK